MLGNKKFGNGIEDADPEVDLSPMIDCVFILLIFFIVTAVFIEEDGVPLPLPEDSSAVSSASNDNTLIFTVSQQNELEHNGRRITVETAGTLTRNAVTKDENTPIIIQSHPMAQHGVRTKIYDEIRGAGGKAITFTQG